MADGEFVVVGGLGLLVGVVIGFMVGSCVESGNIHREAIKHHAGEWRADRETGSVDFHWLEKAEAEND
jgi:hypothetical protein